VLSDAHTLEIEMAKTQSLNDIFAQLSAHGIAVNSMRNKVNRLEELFIRLVDGSALLPAAPWPAAPPKLPHCGRDMSASRAATEWIGFKTIIHSRVQPHRAQSGDRPSCLRRSPPPCTHHFRQLIGRRVGQVGGYDYMQFIAPGLIMMTVITNSYGNVVSSFFGAKFGKHLEELLVSPCPIG